MSKKVKIVNSVTNDRGFIRRKDAEFFVKEKRAEWADRLDGDQIRLILSHPKNQAAARRAAAWTLEPTPVGKDRISRRLRLCGTQGLEAFDNPRLTLRPAQIRRKPWRRILGTDGSIGYVPPCEGRVGPRDVLPDIPDGLLYQIGEADRMVTAEARRQQLRRLLDEKTGGAKRQNEDEDCK